MRSVLATHISGFAYTEILTQNSHSDERVDEVGGVSPAGVRAAVSHDSFFGGRLVLSNNAQLARSGKRAMSCEPACSLAKGRTGHTFDPAFYLASKGAAIEALEEQSQTAWQGFESCCK